jgi:hypothetical protein
MNQEGVEVVMIFLATIHTVVVKVSRYARAVVLHFKHPPVLCCGHVPLSVVFLLL